MHADLTLPDTAPKKFVFVLMPICDKFRDIYEVGIKPACRDAGAYCERVDEQIFHESILEQIYNQISKADLVVADMTGRNPNVFYEVGYAHALNKKTILLTDNTDDIPFDLRHYPHIVYKGSITDLKNELQRRVSWYLSQPSTETHDDSFYTKYYIESTELLDGGEIAIEGYKDVTREDDGLLYNLTFTFAVKNSAKKMLILNRHRIALSAPHKLMSHMRIGDRRSVMVDDNAIVWQDLEADMLPDSLEAFIVRALSVERLIPLIVDVTTATKSRRIGVTLVRPGSLSP